MDELLAVKTSTTVSVVLPALNEERTVGAIVADLRHDLVSNCRLVDELVVMDSGSTDRTGEVAADAGARVVRLKDVIKSMPPRQGKGEALWRSLAATRGDIVVFVDSDLESFSSSYVTDLLGPLLHDDSIHLVKAAYERPLTNGHTSFPAGGGRVTEVVARPLLNLYWPELARFIQPLAGEYAARRALLERLPFPSGYGVEIAILIDSLKLVGDSGLAQVDLGVRRHRNRSDLELGRMSSEIIQAAMMRLFNPDRIPTPANTVLTQFKPTVIGYEVQHNDVSCIERPPMHMVAEYHQIRGA